MAAPETTAPTPRASGRFEALDAWRGVCALSVVLFHLNAGTHGYHWLNNGYVAVDFFFVLSGFVIASAYQGRIDTIAQATRYAVRRLGRLFPLHVAVLAVYLLLEIHHALGHPAAGFTGPRTWPAFWMDLFLLHGFGAYQLTWNEPAWSISVELWSNMAFAVVALAVRRRLPWISALIAAALTLALIHPPPLPLQQVQIDRLVPAFICMRDFFMGVVGYALYRRMADAGWRAPAWLEWPALILSLAVFAFVPLVNNLLVGVAFFAVVMIFAFETGPISSALRRPIPQALGTSSYSIYLTHSLYTLAAFHLVKQAGLALHRPWLLDADGRDLLILGGPWAMDAVALTCLAVVILSSRLTYRWIEDPARLAINRWSNRIGRRAA
jgi:peptidoglycan/LPS O-acetylase OafA/YrhL